MSGFAGQRAIVTGAGRGIGRAVTLDLVSAGVDVLAIARSVGDLDELQREAAALTAGPEAGDGSHSGSAGEERSPGSVSVAAVDVRDAEALDAAITGFGADLLVTAAGINRPGPLTDTQPEDLAAILEINVLGTLLTCRAFGAAAIAAGRPGAAVLLSSQMGVVGYPGRVAYCASKHAVNGITKALALEWATAGIRVNAVAPTFIYTPFTAPMFEDPAFEREVLDRIPIGRIGETQDVTGAVRFLLSADAAMVTGHVLAVDGGWTAQ